MSVAEWLDGAGLGEYAAGFELHGYDELELLRDLTPEETEELALCVGMKRGHVLKFRRRCLGPAQGAVPQPVLTSPALVSPGGAAALLGSPSTPTLTPRPASASASASAAAAASFSASAGSPARASRARAAVRPRRLQKSIAAAAEEDLPPPSQRSSSSGSQTFRLGYCGARGGMGIAARRLPWLTMTPHRSACPSLTMTSYFPTPLLLNLICWATPRRCARARPRARAPWAGVIILLVLVVFDRLRLV